jgi:mono/diheme cytochrome c family protein
MKEHRMRTTILLAALAGAAITASTLVLGQPKSSPQTPSQPASAAAAAASSGAPATPVPTTAASAPTTTATAGPGAPATKQPMSRGEYLVALGDCVACHTEPGGERFAGGLPVATPFGTILSANITPDQDTGIGGWTADQFYRAMHEGIDDEGKHLYPAFPYNYYTKVTREDSDAMFAYLRTLPPVRHEFERNKLSFPFNIRALMTVWNWLYLDKGPYQPDASKSAAWNRGAYLVEGLGHCQACHTPKTMMGGPKTSKAFQGGVFGTWFAPDITANQRVGIGGWKDDALREFLRRGDNVHSAATGEMGDVVAFSTSLASDDDLNAIVTYLRSLGASPDASVSTPDAAVMKQGQAIWQDSCSACHRMDGQGVPRFFPPLQHDANAQQTDPTTVVHYILAGSRKVPTGGAPTPLSMPAYDWKLNDAQVAAVATYVRNSWGNAASAVTADQVKDLRGKLKAERKVSHPPPQTMAHPGPGTLAPANTDSRDNGTANAGRAAPANDPIASGPAAGSSAAQGATPGAAAAASAAASSPSGAASGSAGGTASQGAASSSGGGGAAAGGGNSKQRSSGHPAGVPTPGPG